MTNLEYYKNEIIEKYGENFADINETILAFMKSLEIDRYDFSDNGKLGTTATILNWLSCEYAEPLLRPEERQYLTCVITPFIDNIDYITKTSCVGDEYGVFYECINIICKDGDTTKLPNFKKGTAYKGMMANYQYSLNDLRIKFN